MASELLYFKAGDSSYCCDMAGENFWIWDVDVYTDGSWLHMNDVEFLKEYYVIALRRRKLRNYYGG